MGITRLDERSYRARYRDDAGKEHRKDFAKKGDAQRWLEEKDASLLRGDYVDPRRSRVTVGAWAEGWMAGRVHLKPKTVVGYESLLRTRILPKWKTVPLVSIQNADVVAWVASMRAEGLSAQRTRHAYHLLSSMLDAAVRDRRIASNPAAGVELPRLPRSDRRYLTHAQLAELAGECGDYELFVLVLGYTGIRFGEAAALRVKRVDTMRGRLDIAEAVTEINGRAVFGTPKSHQARAVVVPPFLRDRLAEHLAGRSADELVFTSPRGDVLRSGNFRRAVWNPACVTTGLASYVERKGKKPLYRGLVPHELRHTAASIAIASGANVKAVQRMLGHASATPTLDRYGHLFDDELDAIADRIDQAARKSAEFSRTNRGSAVVELRAADA